MDYMDEIIGKGNKASDIMKNMCAKTYTDKVKIIDTPLGSHSVIIPQRNKCFVVHSCSGDPTISESYDYAESLIERLVNQATQINAVPIAMTDTIEMPVIDLSEVGTAARALYDKARKYRIAIMNGETAGLPGRVNSSFNMSGTMLSIAQDSHSEGVFYKSGVQYIYFKDEGKYIFMNSDGVGTKIEVAERTGKHSSIYDFFAMVADDVVRVFGTIKAISVWK